MINNGFSPFDRPRRCYSGNEPRPIPGPPGPTGATGATGATAAYVYAKRIKGVFNFGDKW